MRFYQYLDEMTLRGELTFGFELEAIFSQKMTYHDMKRYIFDKLWGKDYSIEEDMSIKGYDEYIETPFEFQSDPLNFTPKNIQRSIDFLTKLFTKGDFRTNESCGFHVHFGMPKLNKFEMVGVYLNIAMDEELQKVIMKFKNYNFYELEYADPKILTEIRRLIHNKNGKALAYRLDTDKHRVFRIHPQGTLEGRGPRNFLNVGTADIKDFFKLLYMFVSKIAQFRDSKEIKGYLTLREFEDIYKNSDNLNFNDPPSKKVDKRGNKGQDVSLLEQIFKIAPGLAKADFEDAMILVNKNKNKIGWIYGIGKNGVGKDGRWDNGRGLNGTGEKGLGTGGTGENGTGKDGTGTDGIGRGGKGVSGKGLNGNGQSKSQQQPEPFVI